MDIRQFEARKKDHLRQALDPAHQTSSLSGLQNVQLIHEALPDLDLQEISLHETSLGKTAPTPFYVSAMTAGHEEGARLNMVLAEVCQRRGWAMGLGSQRRDLEIKQSNDKPESKIEDWRKFRAAFPKLRLFSNFGISQLPKCSPETLVNISREAEACAIVIHANALQEALQPEGTPFFKDCEEALEALCNQSPLPVVLKETGCGFSARTLERLARLKLAALDVAGAGGTHWGRIEGARAAPESLQATAAPAFANWGVSTVDSVISAQKHLKAETEVWASGGVRTGVDAAKLIALGAKRVGFAQPALKAALEGAGALDAWMATREYELRVALFCTGCKTMDNLRTSRPVIMRQSLWS